MKLGTLHGPGFDPGGISIMSLSAGEGSPLYQVLFRDDGHIFVRSSVTGATVSIPVRNLIESAQELGIDDPLATSVPDPQKQFSL